MRNSPRFKTELIITFIVIAVVAFMLSVLYQAHREASTLPAESPAPTPQLKVTPVETAEAPQPAVEPPVENTTLGPPQNQCENCHLTGKPGVPQAVKVHSEMGRYCLRCHHINHTTHPMPEEGVACRACHGDTVAVPTAEEGGPNPLTPSNGNLIVVHRPRGVGCPNCHGSSVMDIHLSGVNVHIEDMLKRLGLS
jgi:hypothetical protein